MAKKMKMTSKAEGCTAMGPVYSPSMYVDFDDVKEVKGVSVGDTIAVVIKGTVKSVEQRTDPDDPNKVRSSISLTDFEAEIAPKAGMFDELLSDEDD